MIFISKNSLKLGIGVLVMLNKMFVIVFIFDFYSGWTRIPKTQALNLFPFLTLSVGTNVPCIFYTLKKHFIQNDINIKNIIETQINSEMFY